MIDEGAIGAYAHAAGLSAHLVQQALASARKPPSWGFFLLRTVRRPERFQGLRCQNDLGLLKSW